MKDQMSNTSVQALAEKKNRQVSTVNWITLQLGCQLCYL